jgi:hypothetical protein
MNMKRLLLVAAAALVMSTGATMADTRLGNNCATDDPIVTKPPQTDQCSGSHCARPAPQPFQMAGRR